MSQHAVGVDVETQTVHNMLWNAVINTDLQLYKGSVYKLRWGTPGAGLDLGIPCYEEALRTVKETRWPEGLADTAAKLADLIAEYIEVLKAMDVTTASGLNSKLMGTFEQLREQVRAWPGTPATG